MCVFVVFLLREDLHHLQWGPSPEINKWRSTI